MENSKCGLRSKCVFESTVKMIIKLVSDTFRRVHSTNYFSAF